MKSFNEFVKEMKVKKGEPDKAMARSLFEQATNRLSDLKTLPLNEANASFRFEDAYECIREAVQSFMAKEGYKPYSHEAVVSYAVEKQLLNEAETATFDRYREIRNDITYRGQKTTIDETKEAIDFSEKIINKLVTLI